MARYNTTRGKIPPGAEVPHKYRVLSGDFTMRGRSFTNAIVFPKPFDCLALGSKGP
jgi:hypothetical protein